MHDNGEFKGSLNLSFLNNPDKEIAWDIIGNINKKRMIDISLQNNKDSKNRHMGYVGKLEVIKGPKDIDLYNLRVDIGRDNQNNKWYFCLYGISWKKEILLIYRIWK